MLLRGLGNTHALFTGSDLDQIVTKPAPGQRQLRVLVVEDEAGVRLVLSRLLILLGHSVTAFWSPSAALGAFRADPEAHEVAVVDISMPEMDVWALIEALQKVRPELPCVAMPKAATTTSHDQVASRAQ